MFKETTYLTARDGSQLVVKIDADPLANDYQWEVVVFDHYNTSWIVTYITISGDDTIYELLPSNSGVALFRYAVEA